MARQATSLKTAQRYARKAGLDPQLVIGALVRGGTGHRVDLIMADRSIINYWPKDGTTSQADGLVYAYGTLFAVPEQETPDAH